VTNLQYYFHKNYQAYLDLKNKLELQDIENQIFYENLEYDLEEVEKQGYFDEYIDILEKENLV